MRSPKLSGFTLFELMISITVLGILATVSLPNLSAMLQNNAGETVLNDVARTMSMARASAVVQGHTITMCRSIDNKACNGEWHNGILVFLDRNGNRIVDTNDEIIHVTSFANIPGTLKLSSFPSKQYLQFTPAGVINNQTGNFTWCPADHKPEQAQQLIFNITGRVRFAIDADKDGIREGADGNPLSCN